MTKVMHKFFSMYLFLFTTLYMFRAHSAHHQERQIVPIQPLVTVILWWWPRCVQDGGRLLPTCTHLDFPCRGRIPVVTMVWVVSRIRFKVETSLTRSHTSINSWLNQRQRSPRWRGPHHERQPAHQLVEYRSTLIADYGREKKYNIFNLQKRHCEPIACT